MSSNGIEAQHLWHQYLLLISPPLFRAITIWLDAATPDLGAPDPADPDTAAHRRLPEPEDEAIAAGHHHHTEDTTVHHHRLRQRNPATFLHYQDYAAAIPHQHPPAGQTLEDHAAYLGEDRFGQDHPDHTDHQQPSLHLDPSNTTPFTDHANQTNGAHIQHTRRRTYPQTQHHVALGSTPDQPLPWSPIPIFHIQLHPECHHHAVQLHQHNTPLTVQGLLRPDHLATPHQDLPIQHPHTSHYHPTTNEWIFPSTTCWHTTFHPIKRHHQTLQPHHSNCQRSAAPWAFPTTNNYKRHSPQPSNEPIGWHHTGNSTKTSASNIPPPANTYKPLTKPTYPTKKCSQTTYSNIWQEQWPPRAFPSAPSNPFPTTPTRTRTFGEWHSQNSQGHYSPNRCSQESTNMHTQLLKAGSLGSYCLDVFFHPARISWGWTSHPLAFSARRPWTLHRMLSSRSWSIAVSQLRTVDPSSSQEMWLAVMLSWTPEECMMSRRRCSGHSSPTDARTNGGASTTNTITPPIFGLSTLIRSFPLKHHMQRHHPTPNQKLPDPPSTYNLRHHNLPFSSKSLTHPCHHTTSPYTSYSDRQWCIGGVFFSSRATHWGYTAQYLRTIGLWLGSSFTTQKSSS